MPNHRDFPCYGTKGILPISTVTYDGQEGEERYSSSKHNGVSFKTMSKAPVLWFLLLLSVALLAVVGSLPNDDQSPQKDALLFADFVKEHEKIYANSDEHNRRERSFHKNLDTILRHNENAEGSKNSDVQWKMGINWFADRSQDELPMGLNKLTLRDHHQKRSTDKQTKPKMREESLWNAKLISTKENHISTVHQKFPLSSLPKSVDWREKGVTTPVKNQGSCGSCWAFAATAALESHIAINTGKLVDLSVQELVTCVPNANHCGGTGGCDGNIAELAFDFVSSGRGILTEWQWAYTSGNNTVPACDIPAEDSHSMIPGAIASIDGYVALETNDYFGLMEAVATIGPVVVSVAANYWFLYEGGIFDDSHLSYSSNRDINHAVVVEGYGTEMVTDHKSGKQHPQDYWLVRNSWGPLWGEDGYIRLKRDSNAGQNDCKTDFTPADGNACVGPDNQIIPPAVEVCGTSGVLYSALYPTGGHLLRYH